MAAAGPTPPQFTLAQLLSLAYFTKMRSDTHHVSTPLEQRVNIDFPLGWPKESVPAANTNLADQEDRVVKGRQRRYS